MSRPLRLGIILPLLLSSVPAAAEEAEDTSRGARASRPMFEVGAGSAYRPLSQIPTYGGEVMFGAGIDRRRLGAYGEARYAYAQTPNGLPFHSVHVGGRVVWIIAPVRLGVGLHLGWDAFGRRTDDGLVARWTVGAGVLATVDIATLGSSTILVGIRGEFDVPNPVQLIVSLAAEGEATINVVPGASAFVGVRF